MRLRECGRPRGVLIVDANARRLAHAREKPQLRGGLAATAAHQHVLGVIPREVLRGHCRRGRRAQRRERHRIHDGQRHAILGVTERNDALDGRQAVPRPVVRKVGVELGGEVVPVQCQRCGLYVKAAVGYVHAQDARCGRLPQRVLAKRVLHGRDAFVGRE